MTKQGVLHFVQDDDLQGSRRMAVKRMRTARQLCAATLALLLTGAPGFAQQTDPPQQGSSSAPFTLRLNAEVVLTNVVVRDKKTGEVIKGLKGSDFTIVEDKKPQRIISFDYQNVDHAAVLAEKSTVSGKATIADMLNRNLAAAPGAAARPPADGAVL